MGQRRITRYAEMTSLLDVLFILLFASLIQAAGMVEGATEDREAEPEGAADPAATSEVVDAGAPADASPVDAAPPASHRVLRNKALDQIMRSMGDRQAIYVRVSADGTLTAIEQHDGAGGVQSLAVGVSLLELVDDPDVAAVYAGDRSADLRLCTRVRVTMGLSDLSDRLIVVATDAALDELPLALVAGLRVDQDYCYVDERGVSVLVTP